MTLLSVKNVTKHFGGLLANDSISFDVPEKTVFAVIGPNGAGKTTLFNTISGFFPPSEGTIAFNDADITGVAQRLTTAAVLLKHAIASCKSEAKTKNVKLLSRLRSSP